MEEPLRLKSQFKAVLANYQPSSQALTTLGQVPLVLMMGLSASGRNTVIKRLLETNLYHYIVSDTTRRPRVNDNVLEQNGREYFFRSEEEVLQDLKSGEFLEAAVIHNQQVSGISIRELKSAAKEQKIAITDIQLDGIEAIRRFKPDATSIFMVPPSFEAWLQRMNQRGEMPEAEKRRRLTSALTEIEHLNTGYYSVIVNDDITRAVGLVRQIAEEGLSLPFAGSKAERVITDLRKDIKEHLNYT